jgi:hypothetical protein
MAAVAVAFDGVRLSAAESESDGGTWDDWDKSTSPAQEKDIVYQRGASLAAISNKVGTSEAGVEFEDDGTVDLATTPRVVLFKVWVTNYAILNTIGATAMVLYIGSGTTSDRYNYYVHGSDTYPAKGGWQFIPIDPNVTAYRDATDGTPVLGSADYYAISATFTATSKSENVVMDALDYVDSGAGLTLTAGDGASADGTFQDFVDEDEGTVANRWTVASTRGKAIFILGTLTIGTATATEFTDSNRVLFFPDTLTDVGFAGLSLGLQSASTTITINDCSFIGEGRTNLKRWIDSENEVDGTNDEIDHVAHGFETGQAVLYSDEGGTAISGLTDATEYFVEAVTADAFSLHTTRQAAMTSATPIVLTAAGSGQQHSFRRQPDTRPVLGGTGTSGTAALNRCTFDAFGSVDPTSSWTFTDCKFVRCSAITVGGSTWSGCTFTAPVLTEGESLLSASDLDDLSGGSFTSGGEGHAMRRTGTAGSDTLSGVGLTGYWEHGNPDEGAGAEFTTDSGGVDAVGEDITTNETHGLTTGDAVYYNLGTGVASIGLTNGNRYYVNVISTTNVSLHETKQDATTDTNRVPLNTSGAETHALYSSKAALVNDTGGAMTVTVGGGGSTPYVRNIGLSTTAIVTGVTFTVEDLVAGSEVRIFRVSDDVELTGVESSGTTFAYVYTYVSDTPVRIVIQKFDQLWKQINVTLGNADASQKAGQQPDFSANNPP